VIELLKHAFPAEDEMLLDIGCGDGRILIEAVKRYKCLAVGIEIDKRVADLARENVKKAGLGGRIRVMDGDARKYKFDDVDVITMYLFPDLMEEMQPEMFRARKIVSYSHPIPNVRNHRVGEIYIWEKVK
jgi:cyclopropane fatty-acyl-phospholipid synthase-like methyltransferase